MKDFERSPHPRDERERYLANPLRLLRCAVEMGFRAVRTVDDALVEFDDHIENRPYNETNYPPIRNVEAPVATEEELLWQQDY